MGSVLFDQRRYHEAALAFAGAEPGQAARHGARPGVAWLSIGDFEEALRLLEPLAEQGDPDALAFAGQAAYRLRRYALAVSCWDRLRRRHPTRQDFEVNHTRASRTSRSSPAPNPGNG